MLSLNDVVNVVDRLRNARRPLLLLGAGVRAAGAASLIDLGIPTALTWEAADLLADNDPWYVGRPGSLASRAANFAVQNADVLVSIGARWDMATTGFAPDRFGLKAHRTVVDIDQHELQKLKVEKHIHADAKDFLLALRGMLGMRLEDVHVWWMQRINEWKSRYPIVTNKPKGLTNLGLVDALSNILLPDDVIVQGSSGNQSEIFFMAFRAKRGQRIIADGSFGTMGYGIPAAIGAAVGSGRRTILIDGDGSLMPNVQELETIRRLNLPIKIVVVNNGGYASIRACQDRWFGRRIAADTASGMSFAPIDQLAKAFDLDYTFMGAVDNDGRRLGKLLDGYGPLVLEVKCPPDEERQPRLVSRMGADGKMESGKIEDLWPHLPDDELKANMGS